jgi:hypothetical protein
MGEVTEEVPSLRDAETKKLRSSSLVGPTELLEGVLASAPAATVKTRIPKQSCFIP